MLTYDLTKCGTLALYDYLYRCIRQDILSGKLKAKEKLPSKRAMAENLGVSVVTVENAYAQLYAEGYVYSVERSGFYVEKIERTNIPPIKLPPQEVAPTEKYRADFTSNRVSGNSFPFSVWAKLTRETLLENNEGLVNAESPYGAYPLRKAIADYIYRYRGIVASPENVIIGAGSEYICSLLVQLFGRDKTFALEDPGYKKTAKIYSSNGARCVFLPLDKQGVRMKELVQSKADILHITPTHHYPTGIVTPVARRQEILRWANESENRYVIEDDYDSEFRFSGRPIPTLLSSDTNGKVVYINTFSKSLAPSMRISYMILPDALLREYKEKLSFYSCAVPSFEQYTLSKFIERGYFERHLSRRTNVYKKRRNEIAEKINELRHKDRLQVIAADSGLHFLIRVNTQKTDKQLVDEAKKLNIRISCLSDYSALHEEKYEHFILLNYSQEEYDDLSFLDEII